MGLPSPSSTALTSSNETVGFRDERFHVPNTDITFKLADYGPPPPPAIPTELFNTALSKALWHLETACYSGHGDDKVEEWGSGAPTDPVIFNVLGYRRRSLTLNQVLDLMRATERFVQLRPEWIAEGSFKILYDGDQVPGKAEYIRASLYFIYTSRQQS